MTEKEKKAIELLKQPPELPFIYCERENAIRIVLKLIKKQQKEIKELNKALMTATLKIEGLKIEAIYNNDYIKKDTIREILYSTNDDLTIILKIKELIDE